MEKWQKIDRWAKRIFIGGLLLVLILAVCLCTGCMSERKATNYLKDKGRLAEVCAAEYPVKESVEFKPGDTVTQVIETPGEVVIIYDTVYNEKQIVKIDTFKARCPATKSTYYSIHDTVYITKENTAKLAALASDYKIKVEESLRYKASYEAEHDKALVRLWILIALAAALVVWLYFKVKQSLAKTAIQRIV